MSCTPDVAGSCSCRTLRVLFLSQQGLELLLCPASGASLMGELCQSWLPLLQQKCASDLNLFSLDPSLLLVSALLFQWAPSSCCFHRSWWDLRLLFSLGELESTPAERTAPWPHYCAAKFISLMIWPLLAVISLSAGWPGASLMLPEGREGALLLLKGIG